jgi:muramoyltetrapeptide carboxypeptidase
VNALLCIRGGYGTPRLLPLLDYTVIRKNPKVFIGFSDITALHCAFLLKSNLLSFHGPMLNSDLNKPHCPPFTISSLLKTTMRSVPAHSINAGHPLLQKSSPRASNLKHLPKPQILKKGIASGPLIGGNISLLCGLVGTPYLPPLKGAILVLEDLDEPPYRFDRMLTHLLTAGVFQQIAGIAIGINYNCEDPKAKTFKEYRQTLVDVLKERLLPLKIPMVMNLPFGHIPLNATLPIGANVTLDADNADLIINESAVR